MYTPRDAYIRSSRRLLEFPFPVTACCNASLVDLTNEFATQKIWGGNDRNFDDICCTRRGMLTSGLAAVILDFSLPVTSDIPLTAVGPFSKTSKICGHRLFSTPTIFDDNYCSN